MRAILSRANTSVNPCKAREFSGTEMSQPGAALSETDTLSQENRLCDRCEKIHLDRILRKQLKDHKGSKVFKLGFIVEWSLSSCPLCELFAKAFGGEQYKGQYLNLRAHSSQTMHGRVWQSINTVMLSVEGTSFFSLSPRMSVLSGSSSHLFLSSYSEVGSMSALNTTAKSVPHMEHRQ